MEWFFTHFCKAYVADVHDGDIQRDFVPQPSSVVDKFTAILEGKNTDQENCIVAIELIQKIKPDEGQNLNVRPVDTLVRLELEVAVSCIAP